MKCKQCKTNLVRRDNEQTYQWIRRRFCNTTCVARYQVKKRKGFASIHDSTYLERFGSSDAKHIGHNWIKI